MSERDLALVKIGYLHSLQMLLESINESEFEDRFTAQAKAFKNKVVKMSKRLIIKHKICKPEEMVS